MPKMLDDEIIEVLSGKNGLDLFDIMNAVEKRRFDALPFAVKLFFAPYRICTFGFLLNPGTGIHDRLAKMVDTGVLRKTRRQYRLFERYEYRLASQ